MEESSILKHIDSLNIRLNEIKKELSHVSSDKVKKLNDKILKERYITFFNKTKIIFDADTYHLYLKKEYCKKYNIDTKWSAKDIEVFIERKFEDFDGYPNWKIGRPSPYRQYGEKNIIYSEINSCMSIYGECYIVENKETSSKSISCLFDSRSNKWGGIYLVFPVNYLFNHSFKQIDNFVDFFIEQGLEPDFNNNELNEIFQKYKIRYQLLKDISSINLELTKLQEDSCLMINGFNFDKIIQNYPLELINKSKRDFFINLDKYFDELIDFHEKFVQKNSALIKENIKKLSIIRNKKKVDQLIRDRHDYLKNEIDLELDRSFKYLTNWKRENKKAMNKLDNTSGFKDFLKIANKDSFYDIAYNSFYVLKEQLVKANWFIENSKNINRIVDIHNKWADDLSYFLNKGKDQFIDKCNSEYIDEEISSKWWDFYEDKIKSIEASLLALFKILFENNIEFDIILKIINYLEEMRHKIDDVFNEKLIPFYQSCFNKNQYHYVEKVELVSELVQVLFDFDHNIEEEIFKINKKEQRLLIIDWVKEYFKINFLDLTDSNFSQDNPLIISFREQLRQNYDQFLFDSELYETERQKQYNEINSLIFKIKKEVSQTK